MIFIDLQKTFGIIDYQILIKETKYLGFSKNVIAWFKPYLSEQKCKININTGYSSPSNLINVIPQGSILGPVLLLLYINDLCDWFADNKLSVHFSQEKRKWILLGAKYKLENGKALNIVYNGIEMKQYAKVKYLGCILVQSLSGESMALKVINKINSNLKFLHRQNRFLTSPLCRLLCNALIQLLFDYACTAWLSNPWKRLKLRLQVSQNKCVRFCLRLDKVYNYS